MRPESRISHTQRRWAGLFPVGKTKELRDQGSRNVVGSARGVCPLRNFRSLQNSSTLSSTPTTLRRTAITLWSTPITLGSTPSTLWSTPSTLSSTPSTHGVGRFGCPPNARYCLLGTHGCYPGRKQTKTQKRAFFLSRYCWQVTCMPPYLPYLPYLPYPPTLPTIPTIPTLPTYLPCRACSHALPQCRKLVVRWCIVIPPPTREPRIGRGVGGGG